MQTSRMSWSSATFPLFPRALDMTRTSEGKKMPSRCRISFMGLLPAQSMAQSSCLCVNLHILRQVQLIWAQSAKKKIKVYTRALGLPSSRRLRARLNGLDNFYIPTSNLAICFFVLEDSSPSAETCFDTERSACPQAAAFLSRRTCITPTTHNYRWAKIKYQPQKPKREAHLHAKQVQA